MAKLWDRKKTSATGVSFELEEIYLSRTNWCLIIFLGKKKRKKKTGK